MENTLTWMLIADASKARLYAMHKARFMREQHPSNLTLIQDFTHHDSRKKNADLVSDKMGEFGSGSFETSTPPKTHEANVFAHKLMNHLDIERKNGTFRDLILVAPPTFMGHLHNNAPTSISKMISQQIEKDYTQDEGVTLINKLIKHF
jgi:protein required for attachment to host cells